MNEEHLVDGSGRLHGPDQHHLDHGHHHLQLHHQLGHQRCLPLSLHLQEHPNTELTVQLLIHHDARRKYEEKNQL